MCLYMYIGCLPNWSVLYFLKHDFSVSPELTALSRLPDQQALGIDSSPHYCWSSRHVPQTPAFDIGSVNQIQVLWFMWQAFYWLSHLSSLEMSLISKFIFLSGNFLDFIILKFIVVYPTIPIKHLSIIFVWYPVFWT